MSDTSERDGAKGVDTATTQRAQRHEDSASPRVVHSTALLGGQSHLAILHNETVYFLRQTRFGKLILTK